MFLFTTPATRETSQPVQGGTVVQAIREGAERSGVGFDFLLRTAQRESALDPEAKARTSSATGLFQFIEQTWLGLVKSEGAGLGLSQLAQQITEGEGGRLNVADAKARQDILDLRRDPRLSATLAGTLTQKNAEALTQALGRSPTAGELYIAHVMGAAGASSLIKTAQSAPTTVAAAQFPEAAAANRPLFYDKAGKARPSSEVYALLASSHMQGAPAVSLAGGQTGPAGRSDAQPVFSGLAPERARGLIGLFSTEGSRGPISDAVSRIWSSPRSQGTRVVALSDGERFYPRSDGSAGVSEGPAASQTTGNSGVASRPDGKAMENVPMPPSRPGDLGASTAARRSRLRQAGGPLDLSQFMTRRTGS